jgi:hypothetical protein
LIRVKEIPNLRTIGHFALQRRRKLGRHAELAFRPVFICSVSVFAMMPVGVGA